MRYEPTMNRRNLFIEISCSGDSRQQNFDSRSAFHVYLERKINVFLNRFDYITLHNVLLEIMEFYRFI